MSSPSNNEINYEAGPSAKELTLKAKEMDLEAGLLGKLFGSEKNAPLNIAGLIALLLILTGVGTIFYKSEFPAADYWEQVAPILTGILGYLFGRKHS